MVVRKVFFARRARNDEQSAGCKAIARMADCVIKMLADAVESFDKRDARLAGLVVKADDEVDSLFREARAQLIDMITGGGESKETAERSLDYMLVAKYLERSGDHAVSVAKAVQQLVKA